MLHQVQYANAEWSRGNGLRGATRKRARQKSAQFAVALRLWQPADQPRLPVEPRQIAIDADEHRLKYHNQRTVKRHQRGSGILLTSNLKSGS